MRSRESRRFTKLHSHAGAVDSEFRNVYQALSLVDTGVFRIAGDVENERLLIQVLDKESKKYRTVLCIDKNGALTTGSISYGTLPEY